MQSLTTPMNIRGMPPSWYTRPSRTSVISPSPRVGTQQYRLEIDLAHKFDCDHINKNYDHLNYIRSYHLDL